MTVHPCAGAKVRLASQEETWWLYDHGAIKARASKVGMIEHRGLCAAITSVLPSSSLPAQIKQVPDLPAFTGTLPQPAEPAEMPLLKPEPGESLQCVTACPSHNLCHGPGVRVHMQARQQERVQPEPDPFLCLQGQPATCQSTSQSAGCHRPSSQHSTACQQLKSASCCRTSCRPLSPGAQKMSSWTGKAVLLPGGLG